MSQNHSPYCFIYNSLLSITHAIYKKGQHETNAKWLRPISLVSVWCYPLGGFQQWRWVMAVGSRSAFCSFPWFITFTYIIFIVMLIKICRIILFYLFISFLLKMNLTDDRYPVNMPYLLCQYPFRGPEISSVSSFQLLSFFFGQLRVCCNFLWKNESRNQSKMISSSPVMLKIAEETVLKEWKNSTKWVIGGISSPRNLSMEEREAATKREYEVVSIVKHKK